MTHRSRASRLARAVAALGIAWLSACGDGDGGTSPGVEPEVTNATDNFQFQVTGMKDYSRTLEYTWTNTGTEANVDQTAAITEGTATLVLLEAGGKLVYSRSLAQNGSFASGSGTAGGWTIRVTLSGVTGTLNFRVQKRP